MRKWFLSVAVFPLLLCAQEGLVLSEPEMTSIPDEVFAQSGLKQLQINHTKIEKLSLRIGELTRLERFSIWPSYLTELPAEIGALTNLTDLSISGKARPDTYHHYTSRIAALPPETGHLTQLHRLYLRANHIEHLPDEIGNLTALRQLMLDHNDLASLPESIGALTNLQHIGLHDNPPLSALPASMENLQQLESIGLNHNHKLVPFPEVLCRISAMRSIVFINNDVTDLPDTMTALTNLEVLVMGDSQKLNRLPDWIGGFPKLKVLKFYRSGLASVPKSIGQLSGLLSLDLSHNNLTELPDLSGLQNLRFLWLTGNRFEQLPPQVLALKSLEYLAIDEALDPGNLSEILPDLKRMDHSAGYSAFASEQLKELSPLLPNLLENQIR
jgi:Leucine-rich repeat (LRR) protein